MSITPIKSLLAIWLICIYDVAIQFLSKVSDYLFIVFKIIFQKNCHSRTVVIKGVYSRLQTCTPIYRSFLADICKTSICLL